MTNADHEAPKILDLPIGLSATGVRKEFDSLGEVEVPADRYWGAQTQRSLQHFSIGTDRMPKEVYHAYGYVKKAAALVNVRARWLPGWKGELIGRVCDEVISGALDEQFPPRSPCSRSPTTCAGLAPARGRESASCCSRTTSRDPRSCRGR